MTFGAGDYRYEFVEGWCQIPEGWKLGEVPGVACDSQDRVYLYSRSDHLLTVFDKDGTYLDHWGSDIIGNAHGLYIDKDDNVYCTSHQTHTLHRLNPQGEVTLTIGTRDVRGEDQAPLSGPCDSAVSSSGDLFVADGYGNRKVHRFTPDGELLNSWGEEGDGPGQFTMVHGVRIDKYDRLWVCDRENRRIQLFDTDGNYLEERADLERPDQVYFDPNEDVVYIAELEYRVTIQTLDGETLAQWGGGKESNVPGEFVGWPHGIWLDGEGSMYIGQVHADDQILKYRRV
jgi:sugar lactone lactonase YvrE